MIRERVGGHADARPSAPNPRTQVGDGEGTGGGRERIPEEGVRSGRGGGDEGRALLDAGSETPSDASVDLRACPSPASRDGAGAAEDIWFT